MISVLILTKNEELNLPRCLESLKWCDDVVVLDSFSDDLTEDVAKSHGARFIQREFDDYASQRNFGLNDIEYKYPWLLMVDADEEVPPELVEEFKTMLREAGEALSMVRIRRKDYFQGRWIRHSSGYPTWFGRLLRIGRVRIERAVNEEYVTDGKVVAAKGHLNHYPFNKGFESWFEKHNRYSTMEAGLVDKMGMAALKVDDLFSRDPVKRRRVVKALIYRMPFRQLIIFVALYVFRGGFLEGRAGFQFCVLKSIYEYMIVCKIKEKKLREASLPL